MIEDQHQERQASTSEKPFSHLLKNGAPEARHYLELEELVDTTRAKIDGALSGTPFKGAMNETNYDSRTVHIRELENDPSVVVREHIMLEGQDLDEIAQSTIKGEKEFAKLREEYGVKVASMRSVIGKNDRGDETLFTVVDKIEGDSLSDTKNLPIEAKNELDDLYASLGQHYSDAWKNNSSYWADFQNDQFVYGNKVGENDKHFYMVDVGAQFFQPKNDPSNRAHMFPVEWLVHNTCKGLTRAELRFQPRVQLDKARSKLHTVIDEMLKEKPDDEWLLKSKKVLTRDFSSEGSSKDLSKAA